MHSPIVDIEQHCPREKLGGQYLLCCDAPPLGVIRVSECLEQDSCEDILNLSDNLLTQLAVVSSPVHGEM